MNSRYYDVVNPITIEQTYVILNQMKNSVCKIFRKDGAIATGFFCVIPYKNKTMNVLLTNNHVIDEEYILGNNVIEISINNNEKYLKLNLKGRKIYTNEEYDTTIIQIKEMDNINHFLEIDEMMLNGLPYIRESMYMLHYPEGGKVVVSYGLSKDNKDQNIYYKCSSGSGSAGSPLLDAKSLKVIGIHFFFSENNQYLNVGTLLRYPINEFNNDINIINEFKHYKDEDFTNLKLISKGSFGEIYSAYNIKEEKDICLKKINIEAMKLIYENNKLKDYKKDLDNEIKILKMLSYNKNCVEYFGNYDKTYERIIVMEKCDNNLKEFIKKRGKGLNTKEIKEKFFELNKLFKIIQEKKIIHRDLKLENLLIKYKNKEKTDYIIKLGDYGIGKFKREFSNSNFSGLKGTLETVAPEILLDKTTRYENIVDIFSLGIILFQLSNNLKHPFEEDPIKLIIKYHNYYENDNLEIKFDKEIQDNEFKDLIKKMLKLNPKNRLSWDDYFTHKYFN